MAKIDRRRFVASSAGAIASAALLRSTAKGSPNEVVRVGVVGVHGRGGDHLNSFERVENCDVVAMCDVDPLSLGLRAGMLKQSTKRDAKRFNDIRKMLDDKDIDVISIATPNHWHALMAVWAMQAGKDVYVEKPCSHNIVEGRRLIEFAKRYNKICQHGTQGRSSSACAAAAAFLQEGGIGKVHTAKGLCYKPRPSIGMIADSAPPKDVNYDLWLGPAPVRPYNRNRWHYNWHWHWEYGNGDIGNQGVHQLDIARWGLGKELPTKVVSTGGRYGYKDQGETPNTQSARLDYGDCQLVFEVRGLPTHDEAGVRIGNIWYGADGYLTMEGYGSWTAYKQGGKPLTTSQEYLKKKGPLRGGDHFGNFIKAVRSRKPEDQFADMKEGHLSSALGHLANVSFRLGRTLVFDPETETFPDDKEANKLLTREYRAPYTFPSQA